MQRGEQQWKQRLWCRGNSVTFTSPGSDALASGIRLKEMWVGRIDGYTQKYRGRWICLRDYRNQCLCRSVVRY